MRLKFFSALLTGLLAAGLVAAQGAAKTTPAPAISVRVTPQKRVYRRKIKDLDQSKKTFTVTSPKFTGLSQPARGNMEKLLSYERVFEISLAEETTQAYWLEELFYQVNYNKNGVLTITLTASGSGAYPDSSSKTFVVDLATGKQARARDVFQANKMPGLLAAVRRVEKAELKKHLVRLRRDSLQEEFDAGLVEGKQVQLEDLNNFSVSDKGVTFLYDYGFPHAIEALQPAGRFFLSWAALQPYIKPDGLLGRFIR